MLLITLAAIARGSWGVLVAVDDPSATEIPRQITLAVDDTDPAKAWFVFDTWDTSGSQAYLYGRTWNGSSFSPTLANNPFTVSDDLTTTATYNASVAVFDDGASRVYVTSRFTNGSYSQLEELVLDRSTNMVSGPDYTVADDHATNHFVGRNVVTVDEVNGMVGACYVEDCVPGGSCTSEDTYANTEFETGHWQDPAETIEAVSGRQEHCTAAFESNGTLAVAWASGTAVKIRTSAGTVTFNDQTYEMPAVAVTPLSGVETIQLVALNQDTSPYELVYWHCQPSMTNCGLVSNWNSNRIATAFTGLSRPQVASNDDGTLFVSFLEQDPNTDDRMKVTWLCEGDTGFHTTNLVVDGTGGNGNQEALAVTTTGAVTYDGVPYNNIAVNEDTMLSYTGWVHVVYLKDVDSGAGIEWVPMVAGRPFSVFGCP